MHTTSVTKLSILALVAAAALAGCANTNATVPLGSNVSPNDVAFVSNLYNVVDFDQDIIGPALARNPDPRVASLAKDFLAQGNALEARVKPIAEQEGIQPPVGERFTQRADLHTRIASEMQNSRVDFDQEFLTDEIFSHEQALQSAQEMANSPGGNPQLKAISATATEVLATNLARLRKLQGELLASND